MLGIALFAVSLFVITTTLPQYAVGFSIMGTLILAGTALIAVKQSEDQVKSDRRERKLTTVITWANDIAKCETNVPLSPLPVEELAKSAAELGKEKVEGIIEYHNRTTRTNLIMRYQSLDAMGKRIVIMANSLDKQMGTNLGTFTQQTSEKLEEHVKLGWQFIAGEISDSEYSKHWKSSVDAAMALIEEAENAIE